MFRSTSPPPSTVHASRSIVMVAGEQVVMPAYRSSAARFVDFTVEENGFSAADTFTLTLPLFFQDVAGDPVLTVSPLVSSQLVNQDLVPVQIYVGYPANPNNFSTSDLDLVMSGTMDTARFQGSMMGETVTLSGRNIVGALIDTELLTKYPNTPGSTIAQTFATEHGLQAKITPSPTFAGVLVNKEASQLAKNMSEWDLLLFMAKRDGYICRVKGGTLYYGKFSTVVAADNTNQTPILLTWGQNIESFDIDRSPQAARNITVTVLSYNRDGKTQIKGVASSNTQQASKIAGQLGQRGKYNIVKSVAGLTQGQANALAHQLLAAYSAKQLIGNLTTAGNVNAAVDGQITLAGVGAGLSQNYFINKVVHRFSLTEGYKLDLGFSRQTDYTQADLADSGPDATSGSAAGNSGSVNSILTAAEAMSGSQFYPNSCAIAVNQALTAAGINVSNLGVTNTAYVPSYAGVGTAVNNINDLQPGDLVIYTNESHIGIYAGNGQAWNVSTANGYVWTLSNVGPGNFDFGRRL